MTTRRSFFKRLAAFAVATVAAPIIIREALAAQLPTAPKLNLPELFDQFYKVVKARRNQPGIEFWVPLEHLEEFRTHALKAFTDYGVKVVEHGPVECPKPRGIYEQLRSV